MALTPGPACPEGTRHSAGQRHHTRKGPRPDPTEKALFPEHTLPVLGCPLPQLGPPSSRRPPVTPPTLAPATRTALGCELRPGLPFTRQPGDASLRPPAAPRRSCRHTRRGRTGLWHTHQGHLCAAGHTQASGKETGARAAMRLRQKWRRAVTRSREGQQLGPPARGQDTRGRGHELWMLTVWKRRTDQKLRQGQEPPSPHPSSPQRGRSRRGRRTPSPELWAPAWRRPSLGKGEQELSGPTADRGWAAISDSRSKNLEMLEVKPYQVSLPVTTFPFNSSS